jgi:hypothetical protein
MSSSAAQFTELMHLQQVGGGGGREHVASLYARNIEMSGANFLEAIGHFNSARLMK